VVNGNNVTFASGAATGTKTVKAQSAKTYTDAPTCYSAAVTQSAAVNPLPTITLRSSTASPTVNQNAEMAAIVYSTTYSAVISLTGGNFPDGVTGNPSSSSYTISGTPSATGTFGYSLTATVASTGCTSTAAGTITVNAAAGFTTSTGGPNTAYTTTTWITGTGSSAQTWSDRIVATPACSLVTSMTVGYYSASEYKVVDGRNYYSWTCAYNNRTTLCPSSGGWRVPTLSDFETLINNLGGDTPAARSAIEGAWALGGYTYDCCLSHEKTQALYHSVTSDGCSTNYEQSLRYGEGRLYVGCVGKGNGYQIRCVK
jgi:uncharacterized protein (TIGR02145 family)